MERYRSFSRRFPAGAARGGRRHPSVFRMLFSVLLASALFFAAPLLLSGCGDRSGEPSPAEGQYRIYYLNKNLTELTPVLYTAEASGEEALVRELIGQLMHVPNDTGAVSATGDRTQCEGFELDNGILSLFFDSFYTSLKADRQVLLNAAFTRTLTQIDGVDRVSFYTGGQPLQDQNGRPVGLLGDSDFVTSITNVNSYEQRQLTLYFADETGTKLRAEQREVVSRMDTPLEQVVVEQLTSGPLTEGLRPVLPADTKLLSVTKNDDICYLNFSNEFLSVMADQDPNLTIFAIVNSLSELTNIGRVQIAVDGSQSLIYADQIPLDTLFERNLDYIGD